METVDSDIRVGSCSYLMAVRQSSNRKDDPRSVSPIWLKQETEICEMPLKPDDSMLEREVRTWLESQIPPVKFVDYRSAFQITRDTDSLSFDFLILSPFPMAIELKERLQPQAVRIQAKRLLAQRIVLSDRFGPHIPFVVVLASGAKNSNYHLWI
jgi:hypothetical protein